ncbi:MAG: M48 family metallopeptidase [Candidatus Omnitrophica bacterium]|nr:M48 family metallopeptidase [Candidatus Omnitrophota bacterium]
MEKVTLNGREIIYEKFYRRVKSPRLEFENGMLYLILPLKFTEERRLLENHSGWIIKQMDRFEELKEASKTLKLKEGADTAEFKASVEKIVRAFSAELNVETGKILFRKFKGRWGSCGNDGRITVNTLLMFLPDRLIEYILFHEVAHRVEKGHNRRFYAIIIDKFGDRKPIERELAAYWHLIKHSKPLHGNGQKI